MNHPDRALLSIIVPVYNEVRTVLAVIDRLQLIDLPVAREILIVNDGSTDGTREVLGATCKVEMRPGDVFVIQTPGGGGYGRPD